MSGLHDNKVKETNENRKHTPSTIQVPEDRRVRQRLQPSRPSWIMVMATTSEGFCPYPTLIFPKHWEGTFEHAVNPVLPQAQCNEDYELVRNQNAPCALACMCCLRKNLSQDIEPHVERQGRTCQQVIDVLITLITQRTFGWMLKLLLQCRPLVEHKPHKK